MNPAHFYKVCSSQTLCVWGFLSLLNPRWAHCIGIHLQNMGSLSTFLCTPQAGWGGGSELTSGGTALPAPPERLAKASAPSRRGETSPSPRSSEAPKPAVVHHRGVAPCLALGSRGSRGGHGPVWISNGLQGKARTLAMDAQARRCPGPGLTWVEGSSDSPAAKRLSPLRASGPACGASAPASLESPITGAQSRRPATDTAPSLQRRSQARN